MLNAEAKQFSLNAEGQICYQPMASNPMPGEPIGQIKKGQQALMPEFDLKEENAALREKLAAWLGAHVTEVLEPLVNLQNTDDLPAPVKGICFQVHEAMGITPREGLESLIKDLTPDMRQHLRDKKVRLGPILAFVPALNKPAAVKLRGLLWALWNDKPLPVELPKDGVVSFQIDPKTVDREFYQAIGYPVFGPRAIRIDMLDRVISAVYDGADQGKFQAQHKMAEWLGSSIEDLYAVLSAMGHKQMKAPVEQAPDSEEKSDGAEAPEELKPTEEAAEEKKSDEKPQLATFFLKKGKAFERQKPHTSHRKDTNSSSASQGKSKSGKPKQGKKDKRDHKKDKGPRVIQTGPEKKPEDSPFAILQQLKEGNK